MIRFLICFSFLITNTSFADGWEKILHTYDESFAKVYFLNPDTGFVIGYNYDTSTGIVLKSTDGGETWVRKTVVQGYVNDIQFLNDTVGYIAGRDGFIQRTTNCGILWSNMYDCYDLNDIFGMHFFSPDSAIFVKFTKIVQANSINQPPCIDSIVSSLPPVMPISVNANTASFEFTDSQNGYLAHKGLFARTYDRGRTWNYINPDPSFWTYSAYMLNNNFGIATGIDTSKKKFAVTMTTDGGNHWSDPNPIDSFWVMDGIMHDSLNGFIVGGNYPENWPFPCDCNSVIWKTQDGGISWAIDERRPGWMLTSIDIINDSLAFAVGYGGEIYRKRGPLFQRADDFSSLTGVNVFPNPFENVINIVSDSDVPLTFILFDILGKELLRDSFKRILNVDVSGFAPGPYIYKLSEDVTSVSGKLMKY